MPETLPSSRPSSTTDHENLQRLPSAEKDPAALRTTSPTVHGDDLTESHKAETSLISNPPMSLGREIAFIFIMANAQLLGQAILGQSVGPINIIAASFGDLQASDSAWFSSAFSLTTGTFILVSGRLGDIFGYKLLLVVGYAWSAIWAIVAGCSAYTHNQIFFDFCRAMQGIGCAITLPNAIGLLGATYPPGSPRKGIAFAMFGGVAPGGFLIGAVFASLLAERVWWPWAFWVLAITFAVLTVGVIFIAPNPDISNQETQSFDWLGAFTGVTGLVLFNIAWNLAPQKGWNAPSTIVILIVGVLSFIAFIFIEARVSEPLVPLSSMSGKAALVLICVMLGWSSFGSWNFYLYQFSENIQHRSALLSCAIIAPATPAGFIAANFVAYLIPRVKASWIMLAAMVAFCAGNIILATNPVNRLYWKQEFWSMVLTPFGMDLSFPAASLLLSDAAPKKHQGMMASLVLTTVNYSVAFGLGIAGTVVTHVNNGGLTPEDTLRGYRGAWYSGIGLSGLGIVVALGFVLSDYWHDWKSKDSNASKQV